MVRIVFKAPGVKRIGQQRIEVEAGQPVECQWSDLARHPRDSYEILPEAQPEPEADPQPEPSRTGRSKRAEKTDAADGAE